MQHPRLRHLKKLRLRLMRLSEFIATCRSGDAIAPILSAVPCHLYESISSVSLHDLVDVGVTDSLRSRLIQISQSVTSHVVECPLCSAKGFFCEACRQGPPLYSFEVSDVRQCRECQAYFHKNCYKGIILKPTDLTGKRGSNCPSCLRSRPGSRSNSFIS